MSALPAGPSRTTVSTRPAGRRTGSGAGPARAGTAGPLRAGLLGVAMVLLAGCTLGTFGDGRATPGVEGQPAGPPPVPPAACLLDTAALTATTGLTWTPDASTASDVRCVYDAGPPAPGSPATPSAPSSAPSSATTSAPSSATRTAAPTTGPADEDGAEGGEFVAVDLAPAGDVDPAELLDQLAQVCERGSRADVDSADGFVCRLAGDSVFAAAVRDGRVITLAASGVPDGTTADALDEAFTQELR